MRRALLVATLALAAGAVRAETWVTEGFEAFRRGTFGNAGQNLYVSKAGVLQRIHQFDFDHNGWLDLPYANCQNHHESPDSYVYDLKGNRMGLRGFGARSGTVADLDGDGILDVVVGGYYDMVTPFAPSDIYYGQKDGTYSENNHVRIQTPWAVDCCHGRFSDNGKVALAVTIPFYKEVRVFEQGDYGFPWDEYRTLPIDCDLIAAADFDGDGYTDLACRKSDATETAVYWGGKDGLSLDAKTVFGDVRPDEVLNAEEAAGAQSELEKKFVAPRLLESVRWNGRTCFTLSTGKKYILYACGGGRAFRRVLEVPVLMGQAIAAGDFDGDGLDDLAIASQVRHPADKKLQQSFIWLNSKDGFVEGNRIAVDTRSACAVAAMDNYVLFGQCSAGSMYTNDALLYTFENGRLNATPRRFEGEDMRRVFLFRGADGEPRVFLVNHYSRRSDGYDRAYVYWGDRDGYRADRRAEVPGWCAVETVPADLDDDGWAELIVCNNAENSLDRDPGAYVHHFNEKGFDPSRSFTLQTDIAWGGVVADFNRDGYLDFCSVCDHWNGLGFFMGGPDGLKRTYDVIVYPDTGDEVAVAKKNNSQGILDARKPLKREAAGDMRWPIAVDLDRDGWLEIVVPTMYHATSIVFRGGPDGYSLERSYKLGAYHAPCVKTADLNKDGWPDLLFGGHTLTPREGREPLNMPHHSFVHIYWNGPDGFSESRKCILRSDAADSIGIADFNNDGWLDFFVGSYQGERDRDVNSFLYWNRKGSFREFDRREFITHAVSGVIAADFNRDGFTDLAVANHKVYSDHVGESVVWWNGPDGFSDSPRQMTLLPTCGPHGMSAVGPGNQLTRGPEEFYFSEPWRASAALVVTSADVTAECPPDTWVKIMVRTAATCEGLDAAVWREPKGTAVAAGACLQYRLELGANLSLRTPRVTRVGIELEGE